MYEELRLNVLDKVRWFRERRQNAFGPKIRELVLRRVEA